MLGSVRTGWLAFSLIAVGCGYPDYGFDPIVTSTTSDTGPSDARVDTGPSDARVDAAPLVCPTKGGAMVNLLSFCIDETEVTIASYKVFLAEKGTDVSGQIPECGWNMKYEPEGKWWPPADTYSKHPVTEIDWCDAYAYCKWAGKRLCGGFGNKTTPMGGQDDATKSQWFHACSNGGALKYPYGTAFDAQKCNGANYDAGVTTKWFPGMSATSGLLPVKFAAGCKGTKSPYDKIYDLAGNAWEWTDSCDSDAGGADQCRKRGGGFLAEDGTGTCPVSPTYSWTARQVSAPDVGFRCCAD